MNRFASLYHTDAYTQATTDAIEIMRYCAEIDPQAERLLDIMERFSVVVEKWTKDHTYPAPTLSSDLSGLYAPMVGNSRFAADHREWLANMAPEPRPEHQISSIPHRSSINLPLPPLSEMVVSQPPPTSIDAKMNGMSPQTMMSPSFGGHHHAIPPRTSVSSHSMSDGSESMNGHIEFSFDGLWENWEKRHPGPGMGPGGAGGMVGGGMSGFVPPAPVVSQVVGVGAASPGFGGFAGAVGGVGVGVGETRIPPISTLSPSVPLYHTSSY